jgi:intraflagellar transport protein 46
MDDMDHSGDDFSDDDLEDFEESRDDPRSGKKGATTFENKPYDEAMDFSQDLSVSESDIGEEKAGNTDRERKLQNDLYDEAVDVSQSFDYKSSANSPVRDAKEVGNVLDSPGDGKSAHIENRPFDEALEFSRSGSDESFDTRASGDSTGGKGRKTKDSMPSKKPAPVYSGDSGSMMPSQSVGGLERPAISETTMSRRSPARSDKSSDDEEGGDEDDDDDAEGYDDIEGAYKASDYAHLDVANEVKDLFQYITRYRPQETELDTNLKCFIPDYIPSIGEMDAFIKPPRPDGQQDGLGLRHLDEPASNQSDPTVLELQLRAMSKKQQYGDVVVRSIENAEKNPQMIEKWIQSIADLHRTKPPQQVHYRHNMPDIDTLMEIWPETFEDKLREIPLPSPDLDLSILEYTKVCCALLDIPVNENPVESLHLMFSLFMAFKENQHFQAGNIVPGGPDYGDADVLEVVQGY